LLCLDATALSSTPWHPRRAVLSGRDFSCGALAAIRYSANGSPLLQPRPSLMRKSLLFLATAVLSLAFAPAPFPRPGKRGDTNESDLKKLQGAWTRVQLGIGTQPGADNCAVTITGTRLQFPS